MKNQFFVLLLLIAVFQEGRSQTPWNEMEEGSTTEPMYREGLTGIGKFSIPDAPAWPLFPLHIFGYQESEGGSSNSARIELEHSYLVGGSSQGGGGGGGENGPSSGPEGAVRHNTRWGIENQNGVLNFLRGDDQKVQIGATRFIVGNSTEGFDFQVYGNMILGTASGGDQLDLYADTYFRRDAIFTQQVFFQDKLVVGDEYQGGSGYKLSVDGNILCQEITVETVQEWNDGVFDTDYPLRSLQELEKYIQQNGHLPDIPSEKNIKANGYNLTEMDALLLKKIEELTLYLIARQ